MFSTLPSWLQYFLRPQPDGFVLPFFSWWHGILIAFVITLVLATHHACPYLQSHPKVYNRICKGVGIVLLLLVISQYLFYYLSPYGTLAIGLPCYPCRVAALCTIIALLCNARWAKIIAIYLGIAAALALVVVEFDEFKPLHITTLQFVGIHSILVWSASSFIQVEKYQFNTTHYRRFALGVLIWLIVSIPIDLAVQGNYHFYMRPPIAHELLGSLPFPLYVCVVIGIFELIFYAVYAIGHHYVQGEFASCHNKQQCS